AQPGFAARVNSEAKKKTISNHPNQTLERNTETQSRSWHHSRHIYVCRHEHAANRHYDHQCCQGRFPHFSVPGVSSVDWFVFWKEDQQMGLVRGPISYVGSFLSLSRHATDHTTRRCLHGHWRALLGNADTRVGPF